MPAFSFRESIVEKQTYFHLYRVIYRYNTYYAPFLVKKVIIVYTLCAGNRKRHSVYHYSFFTPIEKNISIYNFNNQLFVNKCVFLLGLMDF